MCAGALMAVAFSALFPQTGVSNAIHVIAVIAILLAGAVDFLAERRRKVPKARSKKKRSET